MAARTPAPISRFEFSRIASAAAEGAVARLRSRSSRTEYRRTGPRGLSPRARGFRAPPGRPLLGRRHENLHSRNAVRSPSNVVGPSHHAPAGRCELALKFDNTPDLGSRHQPRRPSPPPGVSRRMLPNFLGIESTRWRDRVHLVGDVGGRQPARFGDCGGRAPRYSVR